MTVNFEGDFQGSKLKIGLVVGRFNDFISSKLLDGAKDCLLRHGVPADSIHITWVPGAFEIPLAASKMAKTKRYDAIVCLGAIIRGSTPHFDFVASECAKGIAKVSLDEQLPVIFGVLTTNNIEQAIERAGTKSGNKGWECALGAIEMANVLRKIEA